jgi:hypothetical protein
LHVLHTITLAYDPREDRILAVINVGRPDSWACWMTRRLTLALLERATDYVVTTSSVVQRAAVEYRAEVATIQREAAIAQTAPAMSRTEPQVLKSSTAVATELMQRINLVQQGERFRIELRGGAGGGADGLVLPAELQRILQMLQAEVAKAAWSVAPAAPAATAAPAEPAPKPARH